MQADQGVIGTVDLNAAVAEDKAAGNVGRLAGKGQLAAVLGIGGVPINLVVLFYFFSMETKTAAQNSLYIILFSQITSLLTTLITHSVPEFTLPALVLMIAGGIGGGIAGRTLNKRMSSRAVDKLFLVLMGIIILISIYNAVHYMGV